MNKTEKIIWMFLTFITIGAVSVWLLMKALRLDSLGYAFASGQWLMWALYSIRNNLKEIKELD